MTSIRLTAKKAETPAEILRIVSTWPADLRESWEERSAIIQEGAKVTREESELRAYELLKGKAVAK